nr:MAG TPA: hypothetical protein [Microviridae sp.]
MKRRALVVYEFFSLRNFWIESSIDYCVDGTQTEFLDELAKIFGCYHGNCRIKSITFFKSYE